MAKRAGAPFGANPTAIPGTTPQEGRQGPPFLRAFPSFGTPVVRGLPYTPPASLRGNQPAIQSAQAMARDFGTTFPPGKRPRLGATATGQPNSSRGLLGRGTTASAVIQALSASQRLSQDPEPGERTHDFISIQRLVQVDRKDLAFALALKGQFIFNDKLGYLRDHRPTIAPSSSIHGARLGLPNAQGLVTTTDGLSRLLSLPILNYYLRLDDLVQGPPGAQTWDEAEDVLRRYAPEGVVRTDAMESQHPAYRNVDTREYTITVAMRDPNASNIWGLVRQQQPLYLIIKRLPIDKAPNMYTLSSIDAVRREIPSAGPGRQYHPMPMQVVPWAMSHKWRPDDDDLRYVDAYDGVERRGIAIRVGWANYSGESLNSDDVDTAWYDAVAAGRLPRVDLTLNIRY